MKNKPKDLRHDPKKPKVKTPRILKREAFMKMRVEAEGNPETGRRAPPQREHSKPNTKFDERGPVERRSSRHLEKKKPGKTTAWSDGAKWYNEQHGAKGNYYHEYLIIPNALRLLEVKKGSSAHILDIGCGQGVFARHLPETCSYVGIDLSQELLSHARRYEYPCKTLFTRCDAATYSCKPASFSSLISILSLQNMEKPASVVETLSKALVKGGKWLVILNHPYFRIPRSTGWEIDKERGIQYRRVDQYMTPQAVSMQIHPSLGDQSPLTWNFHHPLSEILSWFFRMNFSLIGMEEWCSDKKSTGMYAKQEDRAREEFPLFMALLFELAP